MTSSLQISLEVFLINLADQDNAKTLDFD